MHTFSLHEAAGLEWGGGGPSITRQYQISFVLQVQKPSNNWTVRSNTLNEISMIEVLKRYVNLPKDNFEWCMNEYDTCKVLFVIREVLLLSLRPSCHSLAFLCHIRRFFVYNILYCLFPLFFQQKYFTGELKNVTHFKIAHYYEWILDKVSYSESILSICENRRNSKVQINFLVE